MNQTTKFSAFQEIVNNHVQEIEASAHVARVKWAQAGYRWLREVVRNRVSSKRYPNYQSWILLEAQGEFCDLRDGLACLRLKGRIQRYALAQVSMDQPFPRLGSEVAVIGGKIHRIDKPKAEFKARECRWSNRYPVTRNRALLAKAIESARGEPLIKLNDWLGMNAPAPVNLAQALAVMERLHAERENYNRDRRLEASFYIAENREPTWVIEGVGGYMMFCAPSPDELVEIIKAQRACENERNAIARVGRRIKEEPVQTPARRVARL